MGRALVVQAWKPKSSPWNLCEDGRGEPVPQSYPLTFTRTIWHVHSSSSHQTHGNNKPAQQNTVPQICG